LCWGQCQNYHIRHSQGWINEVIEDIDELVKEWLWRQQRNCIYRLLGKCGWRLGKFEENIHIDLGSDQTSYTIHTQEDIIQLAFPLRMRTKWWQKPRFIQRESTGNITPSYDRNNKHTAKGTYWLWKCFY
jgi:urocanate hydratase